MAPPHCKRRAPAPLPWAGPPTVPRRRTPQWPPAAAGRPHAQTGGTTPKTALPDPGAAPGGPAEHLSCPNSRIRPARTPWDCGAAPPPPPPRRQRRRRSACLPLNAFWSRAPRGQRHPLPRRHSRRVLAQQTAAGQREGPPPPPAHKRSPLRPSLRALRQQGPPPSPASRATALADAEACACLTASAPLFASQASFFAS